MKVRVHARVRVSTVAQSFFICRTHANYSTTPVGFSEREFIEAGRWRPPGRAYFAMLSAWKKADLIDTRE